MGLRVGSAFVDILPRVSRGFDSDVDKAVSGPAERAGKKAGGLLGGALGKAVAAGAGLVVAKKAADFLGGAMDAARESNKISAQSEAVIRSTGGAANLTAKQFGSLASAISKTTAVDDEAIQQSENLLATFTNVKDGVGKTNKIFSEATAITVDMGAALKNGPAANAILVGKALNDPIKGISALTRVGVTFSAQQKEQIANFVAQGKTAEAQKVILGELRKEFGGSAAAQATSADRMRVAMGHLQEAVGRALVPVMDKLARTITPIAEGLANLGPTGRVVIGVVGGLAAAVFVAVKATQAYTAIQGALNVVMSANPIGLVVLAIAALVGGLVLAYTKSETFRDIVQTAMGVVAGAVGAVIDVFKTVGRVVSEVVGGVVGFLRNNWQTVVVGLLTGPVGLAVLAIQKNFDSIVGFVRDLPGRVLGFAGKVVDAFAGIGKSILDGIAKGIGAATSFVGDFARGLANALIDVLNRQIIQRINEAIPNSIKMPRPLPAIPLPDNPLPKIPSFDRGGIVPGLTGSPQLVVAHGGETVLPTHRYGRLQMALTTDRIDTVRKGPRRWRPLLGRRVAILAGVVA